MESILVLREGMMINLTKSAAVCVVMTFMLASTTGVILAQDAKTVEGTLIGADATARVITLKAGDTEIQFTYTEQTELASPQKDGPPVPIRQGSRLKITYKENGKSNIATKIEILEL
jgi:hypothetical protein